MLWGLEAEIYIISSWGGINVEKGSLSSIYSNGNDFPKPRQVEQYSKVSLVEMICMNRGVES